MKKFFIGIIMMLALGVNNSSLFAQNYTIEGKNIKATSSRASRDTLISDFTLEDSKGVKRNIVFNKNTGHAYTCRVSKAGKFYRASLPKDLWEWEKKTAQTLGLPYKEHKSK